MTINTTDRNNVFSYGQALVTRGLVVQDGVNGYGNVTSGFLWQGDAIWISIEDASPITTTWTPSKLSTFGEFPPQF